MNISTNEHISAIARLRDYKENSDYNEIRKCEDIIRNSLISLGKIPNINAIYNYITSYPHRDYGIMDERTLSIACFIDCNPQLFKQLSKL